MRLAKWLIAFVAPTAVCCGDVLGQTVCLTPSEKVEGPAALVVVEEGQSAEARTEQSAPVAHRKTLFGQARLHYRPTITSPQADKSLVGFLKRAFARRTSQRIAQAPSYNPPVDMTVNETEIDHLSSNGINTAAEKVDNPLRAASTSPAIVGTLDSSSPESPASIDLPELPEPCGDIPPTGTVNIPGAAHNSSPEVTQAPATIILPFDDLDAHSEALPESEAVSLTAHVVPAAPVTPHSGPNTAPTPETPHAPVPSGNSPDASSISSATFDRTIEAPRPTNHVRVVPEKPSMAHADDYSWVQGTLYRVHVRGGVWVVRYASLDVTDRFGGSLVLARDHRIDDLHEGDLVRVQGELLNDRSSVFLGGPLYRVLDVTLLQRASD